MTWRFCYPSRLSFVCCPYRTVLASVNWHHAHSIDLMTKQPQRISQHQAFLMPYCFFAAGGLECEPWPPLPGNRPAILALLSTFSLASPRTSRSRCNRKPCTDAAPFSSSLPAFGAGGDRSNTQCALLHTLLPHGSRPTGTRSNGLGP